ncbi:hypothetical protein [Tsukamurella sp. PLM1]|uniref:hypothetical protein n=1 Tax=Tsukamurella sp. PLM1 TaxID=2929795 RepID=UPI0020453272|nr:hypothetical protein [Tsukamurella sp. PLM1]BDH58615.1 hypothetical protein MTP03_35540 [Tsukamurella sp. PLM1]
MIAPIVDAAWVAAHPDVILADTRCYLDGRSTREAYDAGHLPGAVYVDLDAHLAAPPSAAGAATPCRPPRCSPRACPPRESATARRWSRTTTWAA